MEEPAIANQYSARLLGANEVATAWVNGSDYTIDIPCSGCWVLDGNLSSR